MITVLFRSNYQTIFHALYPLITSKHRSQFYFTSDRTYCLKKDKNKILVVVSIFKQKYDQVETNRNLLSQFKSKYDKVIFFDDSDGADSLHVELIEYVDLYYKKQLLRDRNEYNRKMYGRQLFSDYYYQNFNAIDREENIREASPSPKELEKVKLAWNIGASIYPQSRVYRKLFNVFQENLGLNNLTAFFQKRDFDTAPTFDANRKPFIQARFGFGDYTPSIGHQRKLLVSQITKDETFLTGRVKKAQYIQEQKECIGVLSPFGWGEVCHRDFEAAIAGSVVIKPSMEHIETWPNIFINDETYLAVKWDASDLIETKERVISNMDEAKKIAKKGQEKYFEDLQGIENKVEQFIEEITA